MGLYGVYCFDSGGYTDLLQPEFMIQGFAGSASARGGGRKFRARFHSRLGNPCKFTRTSLHLNKRKAPLQISTKICRNRLNNIYFFGPKLVSYIYCINIAPKCAKSALIKPY